MLAAVFAREGLLELQERSLPEIQNPDDLLIEVEGCGICGTDLHILDVPPAHPATAGVILGHEYLGRILATGRGVSSLKPGRRVAVAPNLWCGLCGFCRTGRVNHCEHFTTLGIFRDGGLAPYSVAPERACYPISAALPFQDAVWTEVLSCVISSVDHIKPLSGETVLVIGAGPAGALHALLFLAAGARVFVSDLKPKRLELLKKIGVHRTINVAEESLKEVARKDVALGFDAVVDCVGGELPGCLELVGVGGRISLFGMNSQASPRVPQDRITRKELTIYGSFVGVNTFPRAIEILEQGVIKPSSLISRVVSLDQIHCALQALREGEDMKIVIRHRS